MPDSSAPRALGELARVLSGKVVTYRLALLEIATVIHPDECGGCREAATILQRLDP